MAIREASAADWLAISAIIKQFPGQLMQDHLPEPEEFFVAEESLPAQAGGTIVACCALEVYSKRLAEIRSLAVLPAHQGNGIAGQLIERCMARAKEQKVYEVLTVTGTPAFFEKHGFNMFQAEKYALLKVIGE